MTNLKHLVVILPGILGSVLHDRRGREVWGPSVWDIARTAVFSPTVLSVAENTRLDPVSVLHTTSIAGPVARAPGYDVLVRNILNAFPGARVDTARGRDWSPGPGTDVLLVPYDFRLGVEAAAMYVRDRVAEQLALQPGRRVLVLAHSMGGLVARYWLGCLEVDGRTDASLTDVLVTIGTPHGGAPKALDVLVNGFRLGPRRFRSLTALTREWRSVFDLMPRYPAVAVPDTRPMYVHDLSELGRLGIDVPAREAHRMHDDIDAAWAGMSPARRLTALFSCGHATLTRAVLADSGLTVTKEAAEWMPNPSWKGDGTVPSFCAIPNGLADRNAWRPVPERHLPMLGATEIINVLRAESGDSVASVRGERPEAPWLGLDLGETYPQGPITVTTDLLGAVRDDRTGVWLTALRDGRRVADPAADVHLSRSPPTAYRRRRDAHRHLGLQPPTKPRSQGCRRSGVVTATK